MRALLEFLGLIVITVVFLLIYLSGTVFICIYESIKKLINGN